MCDRELFELQRVNDEQRQEIDALKIELYWREFDIRKMRKIISLARHYYRTHYHITDENDWSSYIGSFLKDRGLEVQITDEVIPGNFGMKPEPFCEYCMPRSELDVHFTCDKWYHITSFGAKLWKAKSVDDPEVLKIKAMFNHVKNVVNDEDKFTDVLSGYCIQIVS